MAEASAPPWEPTPSCRIATVKATISPSLSAKVRVETFSKKLLSVSVELVGVHFTLHVRDVLFWDVCGLLARP